MSDHEALRAEALRIHDRYVREVVEAFGFCPWAAPARARGRVQSRVLFGELPELEPTLQAIEGLECDESADIGLLIYPEARLDRVAFQHFAAGVRARLGSPARARSSAFAVADFHPDAAADTSSPARLVPFIRRSPDPSLQLVRHAALEAVRHGEAQGTRFLDAEELAGIPLGSLEQAAVPLHERVARANVSTVLQLGVEQVAAVIDAIARDRDLSYARLGLAPRQRPGGAVRG